MTWQTQEQSVTTAIIHLSRQKARVPPQIYAQFSPGVLVHQQGCRVLQQPLGDLARELLPKSPRTSELILSLRCCGPSAVIKRKGDINRNMNIFVFSSGEQLSNDAPIGGRHIHMTFVHSYPCPRLGSRASSSHSPAFEVTSLDC